MPVVSLIRIKFANELPHIALEPQTIAEHEFLADILRCVAVALLNSQIAKPLQDKSNELAARESLIGLDTLRYRI